MPQRRYYCDYCGRSFLDSQRKREAHFQSAIHQNNVKMWFQSRKGFPFMFGLTAETAEVLQQSSAIPICEAFKKNGFCQWGNNCPYRHIPVTDDLREGHSVIPGSKVIGVVRQWVSSRQQFVRLKIPRGCQSSKEISSVAQCRKRASFLRGFENTSFPCVLTFLPPSFRSIQVLLIPFLLVTGVDLFFFSLFDMDSYNGSKQHASKARHHNVVRESDVRADPAYKEKKEFFDQLKLRGRTLFCYEAYSSVQMNCTVLQENAVREAKSIKDNLAVLISQLPARIQKMKVSSPCFR